MVFSYELMHLNQKQNEVDVSTILDFISLVVFGHFHMKATLMED